MASFFTTREGKLRFIRIANDIEEQLATYVATVTIINFCLGVVVALGAWLFGLPNPIILGLIAMTLNYIPYIGAACTTLILLGVGLVSFPSLGYALVPPAAFVGAYSIRRAVQIMPTGADPSSGRGRFRQSLHRPGAEPATPRKRSACESRPQWRWQGTSE
jgi:hypothetical protein